MIANSPGHRSYKNNLEKPMVKTYTPEEVELEVRQHFKI
jgi:hypothetical protein